MSNCEKCKCSNIIESEDGYYCLNCGWDSRANQYKKNTTNADRIRQMTDEELAELFVYWSCDDADYTTLLPIKGVVWGTREEMIKRNLEYLKQEVEEKDE